MPRLRRLAPYLLLGPVSGPLVAAAVFHWNGRRPFLATLYVVAVVEFYLLMPAIASFVGKGLV